MKPIKLQVGGGVTLASVDDLFPYKDNPKDDISPDNLDRLFQQIELGEHSPLLITEEGEVLGGNSRLKAYRALKKKTAKVIVVKFLGSDKDHWTIVIDGVESQRTFDTMDQAKFELALSHNDSVNPYNPEKLSKLMKVHELPMSIYSVSTSVKPIETAVADSMIKQGSEDDNSGSGEEQGSGATGGGDSWRCCPECGYEGEAKEFFPKD